MDAYSYGIYCDDAELLPKPLLLSVIALYLCGCLLGRWGSKSGLYSSC